LVESVPACLIRVASAGIAGSQKALTSLSEVETGTTTATATSPKALTSLAVPVADILAPVGRSDRAATGTK